jgi:hypothetical protein
MDNRRLAGIETRIAVTTVMVAGLYGLMMPVLWMSFCIGAKTGAFL